VNLSNSASSEVRAGSEAEDVVAFTLEEVTEVIVGMTNVEKVVGIGTDELTEDGER